VIKPVMLDSAPLGKIAHPRPNPEITKWLMNLLSDDIEIIIPEISDYEVRRSLLLSDLVKSVARLDELKQTLTYLPITTQIMLKAAELWAEARKLGKPTADVHALDGDVILSAQALQVNAVVATENVGHLSLFVTAINWKEISINSLL
jgi:predicted nucleic acid-binding protein